MTHNLLTEGLNNEAGIIRDRIQIFDMVLKTELVGRDFTFTETYGLKYNKPVTGRKGKITHASFFDGSILLSIEIYSLRDNSLLYFRPYVKLEDIILGD